MKKIERAIEHLEAAVRSGNARFLPNSYERGVTEGLKQALNACREIATGEHQTYEALPTVGTWWLGSADGPPWRIFTPSGVKTVAD